MTAWPAQAEVNQTVLIHIDELRVGMFIQLGMSWIQHPFPVSSFRLSSQEQIRILRGLGVQSVRYIPAKSAFTQEAAPSDTLQKEEAPTGGEGNEKTTQPQEEGVGEEGSLDSIPDGLEAPADALLERSSAYEHCSRCYHEAAAVYSSVSEQVQGMPHDARMQAENLVQACVEELMEQGPCAVRLLEDSLGQRSAAHAVNVMVLALLLGRTLGLKRDELHGAGMAALLHDLGKIVLPVHIAEPGAPLVAQDRQRYEEHVGHSVELGQRMGLASDVLIAIAQHHEMADGSGFPLRLVAEDLSRNGQILALVNRYDRLCNPLHGTQALTPHEALSLLFAQQRGCFDSVVLGAFIRMMGVYPPGSLVQLADGRFALVVLVNPAHPLRPRVLPYQPQVPRCDAVLLDLVQRADLGIRRSLKPAQLPREVLDYLSAQQRICYFFERAVSSQHFEDRA